MTWFEAKDDEQMESKWRFESFLTKLMEVWTAVQSVQVIAVSLQMNWWFKSTWCRM